MLCLFLGNITTAHPTHPVKDQGASDGIWSEWTWSFPRGDSWRHPTAQGHPCTDLPESWAVGALVFVFLMPVSPVLHKHPFTSCRTQENLQPVRAHVIPGLTLPGWLTSASFSPEGPEVLLTPGKTGLTSWHWSQVFWDLFSDRFLMKWDLQASWVRKSRCESRSDPHSHSCLFAKAAEAGTKEVLLHKRLAELMRTCCLSFWDVVLNRIMK